MNEAFTTALRDIQEHIPELACRVVPSSFDPAEPDLLAVPVRPQKWHTLGRLLTLTKPRGAMTRLPPLWQAAWPFRETCRAHDVPILLNDIANMPVGARAIKGEFVDLVVAEADDAARFARYCTDMIPESPKAWLIVHAAHADTWSALTPTRSEQAVAHEVHIFPNVPVLEQCNELMKKNEPLFHLVPHYEWKLEDGTASITSIEDELLPFRGFQLPFALEERDVCACGQPLFSKRV